MSRWQTPGRGPRCDPWAPDSGERRLLRTRPCGPPFLRRRLRTRTPYVATRPPRRHFTFSTKALTRRGPRPVSKAEQEARPLERRPLPPTWEVEVGRLPVTTQAPSLDKQIRQHSSPSWCLAGVRGPHKMSEQRQGQGQGAGGPDTEQGEAHVQERGPKDKGRGCGLGQVTDSSRSALPAAGRGHVAPHGPRGCIPVALSALLSQSGTARALRAQRMKKASSLGGRPQHPCREVSRHREDLGTGVPSSTRQRPGGQESVAAEVRGPSG